MAQPRERFERLAQCGRAGYGISSIPHTMLIDRDGSILATHLVAAPGISLRGIFGE